MIDGVTTTVKVAHVRLCHVRLCHGRICHGRMTFVRAHPRESQERVFDAHDRAFALFGGACTKGIHDSGHCPPLVRGQWARRPRWTRSSWAASAPTTAAFSRRAATTGSNPSPARRPRAGRRGRACPAPDAGSRDLRGHGPAALLRAAGEGEEPRGTRRLAGGPLHGLGQGASPSASARRRRFGRRRSGRRRSGRRRSGRRRSGRRSRPSDRASWRIAGPSRQRREPSCGAPAVRFAPEARALLHLRCASRQRREPSCGAPAVRFARGASPLVPAVRRLATACMPCRPRCRRPASSASTATRARSLPPRSGVPSRSAPTPTASRSARTAGSQAEHRRAFGRGRTIHDPWRLRCPCSLASRARSRGGAPFKGWELPDALERIRRKLRSMADGDRPMVEILGAVRGDGLPAVEAACAEALGLWRPLGRCDPQHPGPPLRGTRTCGATASRRRPTRS